MNLKVLLFNLVALLIVNYTNAQKLKTIGRVTKAYSSYELEIEKNTIYQLEFPEPASSLSIVFPSDNILSTYLIEDADTITLQIDSHIYEETGIFSSFLVVFDSDVNNIQFYSGDLHGKIQIHLNHTPSLSPGKMSRTMSDIPCAEPSIILPSTWRLGLSAPVNLPECTEVEHVIVHHSVTSNSVSNYEQVVRDIYAFHTKPVENGGRGFDDIAYNYLIAPDGTVYQGRDDQGVCDKDNVKGAHMCGRNTNTMGACLLGTFTNVKPTDNALNSLYRLAAWKLNKEGLSAYGSSWHPVINPVVILGNVAGHREGCDPGYTECPGDSVFYHLNTIRDSVNLVMSYCIPASVDYTDSGRITVFPHPAKDIVYIEGLENKTDIKLYSSHGKVLKQLATSDHSIKLDLDELSRGVYFLEITSSGYSLIKRVVIE